MSTIRADSVAPSAGGTSRSLPRGVAAAWVNFDGSGTIAARDSVNLSSLTDNGTGDYTINRANAMANSSHATLLTTAANRTATDQAVINVATNGTAASTQPELHSATQTRLRVGNVEPTFANIDNTYIAGATFGSLA